MAAKKRKKKSRVSNGVKAITIYLETNNIRFKKEHRFKECRDKLPLPFDFAILKDKEIVAVIEYNGVQHYKSVRRWKGKKGLIKQQLHDLIKIDYCKINKIPFLVISYEDEDKSPELLQVFLLSIEYL